MDFRVPQTAADHVDRSRFATIAIARLSAHSAARLDVIGNLQCRHKATTGPPTRNFRYEFEASTLLGAILTVATRNDDRPEAANY